jgi:hypothetical protein
LIPSMSLAHVHKITRLLTIFFAIRFARILSLLKKIRLWSNKNVHFS